MRKVPSPPIAKHWSGSDVFAPLPPSGIDRTGVGTPIAPHEVHEGRWGGTPYLGRHAAFCCEPAAWPFPQPPDPRAKPSPLGEPSPPGGVGMDPPPHWVGPQPRPSPRSPSGTTLRLRAQLMPREGWGYYTPPWMFVIWDRGEEADRGSQTPPPPPLSRPLPGRVLRPGSPPPGCPVSSLWDRRMAPPPPLPPRGRFAVPLCPSPALGRSGGHHSQSFPPLP